MEAPGLPVAIITHNDYAMQIIAGRGCGPLIAYESSKRSRLIVRFCMIDNLLPNGAGEIFVRQWVVTCDNYIESPGLKRAIDVALLVQIVRLTTNIAGENCRVRPLDQHRNPETFGMIGNDEPVEGPHQLDGLARTGHYLLPLRESIRFVGAEGIANEPGIP